MSDAKTAVERMRSYPDGSYMRCPFCGVKTSTHMPDCPIEIVATALVARSESTPTFALAQKLNEIDAARYRWLRNHPKNGEKEWWPSVWMSRDPLCTQPLQAGFLDDEIDNAMRREALNAHMEGL